MKPEPKLQGCGSETAGTRKAKLNALPMGHDVSHVSRNMVEIRNGHLNCTCGCYQSCLVCHPAV